MNVTLTECCAADMKLALAARMDKVMKFCEEHPEEFEEFRKKFEEGAENDDMA